MWFCSVDIGFDHRAGSLRKFAIPVEQIILVSYSTVCIAIPDTAAVTGIGGIHARERSEVLAGFR